MFQNYSIPVSGLQVTCLLALMVINSHYYIWFSNKFNFLFFGNNASNFARRMDMVADDVVVFLDVGGFVDVDMLTEAVGKTKAPLFFSLAFSARTSATDCFFLFFDFDLVLLEEDISNFFNKGQRNAVTSVQRFELPRI